MRVLLGERPGPLGAADLADAYPWPAEGPWLRSMTVMTLDGATAGGDGRSRSISSTADREVLATTRRFSDVVLIGAGTFRAERYRPMRARPADREARAALRMAPAPTLVIVSGSLDLPWDEPAFAESDVRTIVVTTETADPDRVAVASARADVVSVPGPMVDLRGAVGALHDRGLRRIVCEGGPQLLADLVRLDLVDEVDLTISPLMTGGGGLGPGRALAVASTFALAQLIADSDGFVYARYLRLRGDEADRPEGPS